MTLHELKLDRYGEDKDWVLLECVFSWVCASTWPAWGDWCMVCTIFDIFRVFTAVRAADQISFAADQLNKMRRVTFLEDNSPGFVQSRKFKQVSLGYHLVITDNVHITELTRPVDRT